MNKYTVKFDKLTKWGIYSGTTLMEGGFSSKAAAEDYLFKEYR